MEFRLLLNDVVISILHQYQFRCCNMLLVNDFRLVSLSSVSYRQLEKAFVLYDFYDFRVDFSNEKPLLYNEDYAYGSGTIVLFTKTGRGFELPLTFTLKKGL